MKCRCVDKLPLLKINAKFVHANRDRTKNGHRNNHTENGDMPGCCLPKTLPVGIDRYIYVFANI